MGHKLMYKHNRGHFSACVRPHLKIVALSKAKPACSSSVVHTRLWHWVSYVGWHTHLLTRHNWPLKMAPWIKMPWRQHNWGSNSWLLTNHLLTRIHSRLHAPLNRLACRRTRAGLTSYWALPLLCSVPVVHTRNVMNAGPSLVLVDRIQTNEILLCMTGHLRGSSWNNKVSRYAAPISLPKFRQSQQKEPALTVSMQRPVNTSCLHNLIEESLTGIIRK